MRLHYLRDINSPLPVMEPAMATSVAGSKTERFRYPLDGSQDTFLTRVDHIVHHNYFAVPIGAHSS
jgi:hypothetical protein